MGDYLPKERQAVWASWCLGWLHAASFGVSSPSACNDAPSRVFRGHDLEFLHEGQQCSLWEASGVALQMRESKADQFGRGQTRIQHALENVDCPVQALRLHAEHNPE